MILRELFLQKDTFCLRSGEREGGETHNISANNALNLCKC